MRKNTTGTWVMYELHNLLNKACKINSIGKLNCAKSNLFFKISKCLIAGKTITRAARHQLLTMYRQADISIVNHSACAGQPAGEMCCRLAAGNFS